jgi:phage terminase large subunit GpA-like protein
VVLPACSRGDLLDRGALGALEQINHHGLLRARADGGLPGAAGRRFGLTLGRLGREVSWGLAGAAARQLRTAVAVKGRDRDTALLLSVSKADAGGTRRGLRVWSVGTPVAKGELYRWLKLAWPTEEAMEAGAAFPPGACHFPQYGEEYFKQLTAERLVTRMIKGFPRGSWEKEPGRRNEALDCRVYARAAAAICGLDRFEERHWRRMEEALAGSVEHGDEQVRSGRPSSRPPARQVIQSGYMVR